nr:hypothetical protein [Bacteroidota bacterium]
MKNFKIVFSVISDKESFFDGLDSARSKGLILKQILTISLLLFIYGMIMGSYYGLLQSVVAGIKLVLLFMATLLICFPSFFIIQQVLGSKMNVRQMVIIILSGFILSSTITLSFAPVVVFFMLTGNNYHFLQLLHVAIFIFSGIFGIKLMVDALKYACDKKSIYPQLGVSVFRIWIVILAFVGIQLAWNLRPFMGERTEEFQLFRKYEGNFYTAVIYSARQLAKNPESDSITSIHNKNHYTIDTGKIIHQETEIDNFFKE